MTRRDYKELAATLKRTRESYAPHWDANLFRACTDHAKAIADYCASRDPKFDRARFLKNAGVPL